MLLISLIALGPTSALGARCLYVSSYHPGYEWSDGIERGLSKALHGHCELERFYLDTKRNKEPAFARARALEAKTFIDKHRPDVLIACDDNASKYLIVPYLKNAPLPVVFCGVNHSVEPYGYPFDNTTGMIEMAPVRPLMQAVRATLEGDSLKGVYLSPDVLSQHREFTLNQDIYGEAGIELRAVFVKTSGQWKRAFVKAQGADFVVIGSNGGLKDWDTQDIERFVHKHTRTLTITNMDWMNRYAVLAITKVAEEQGEWSGQAALEILRGAKPADIPVVVNRRWDLYINPELLEKTSIELPAYLMHKAVKVRP